MSGVLQQADADAVVDILNGDQDAGRPCLGGAAAVHLRHREEVRARVHQLEELLRVPGDEGDAELGDPQQDVPVDGLHGDDVGRCGPSRSRRRRRLPSLVSWFDL